MNLVNVDSNFSVESFKFGKMTVEFVHNVKTMENYFNQKMLSLLFDVDQSVISKHLNKYLKLLEEDNSTMHKMHNACIFFKTDKNRKEVKFYDFNAVTYLAFKINTSNAVNVRNFISSTLNTMFNVATGQLDIDTQVDKLRKMQEVEEFKSNAYLNASNALRSVDKDKANELYHLHKVHYHNALNCYDLLVSKDDWKNRYEVVDRQINGKIDNTRQLTF